jgi:dGTP triphosphohydrolase
MMEDETLQLITIHFKELRNNMRAGQVELKTDITLRENGHKGHQDEMKNDISAVKDTGDKISVVKNDIEDKIQKSIRAVKDIIAMETKIEAGQTEFEERMTRMLDTQLKNVTTRVKQQA